jgi:two-component system sensor histidine kinase KdpD
MRDPDEILGRVKREQEAEGRGSLKVFFGYAAGVGKTYAMLRSAHEMLDRGIDVVVGYVEPHARPDTNALLDGLETIPTREVIHGGVLVNEPDLDAILQRHPDLVLMDELAHTNAYGSRHSKRYQDVEELLRAGIDVYTTVNVQHLESLNDRVASITGVQVAERIPDHVFDDADQVELVDIEPDELMGRLREGKVYRGEASVRALENFFDEKNLTALREIALRRCADRVNHMVDRVRASAHDGYYTGEHVLACLSGSPSNGRIIRTAARMARAFNAEFTALLVRDPKAEGDVGHTSDQPSQLAANVRLAEHLGARVETVYGDDVAQQVADYARMAGVSKLVLGHSTSRRHRLGPAPLSDRIATIAPDLDIYIIPDESSHDDRRLPRLGGTSLSALDNLKCVAVLAAVTLLGYLLEALGISETNIVILYVFGVVAMAVVVPSRLACVIYSVVSVLAFNYFFTVPRYTFMAWDAQYPATFAIMLLTALLTSSLAQRLKAQAQASAAATYRTQVLLECDQLLQRAKSADEVVEVMCGQLMKLLHRDVVYYPAVDGALGPALLFSSDHVAEADAPVEVAGGVSPEADAPACMSASERGVATWVFRNNEHAGATTDTLGSAKCLYLAVRADDVVYGVVGIVMGPSAMDASEHGIVLSILGETALALEKERALGEREKAAVVARNEQLRSNLLRCVSHDLRTPLTSISGNASVLLSDGEGLSEEGRHKLESDIYDDALWLNELVENLLSMTKLDEGSVRLDLHPELLDELVDEAMNHISSDASRHHVEVSEVDDLTVVRADAQLVIQVILNLVNNAIQHTPDGSHIVVRVAQEDGLGVVEVADDGLGVSASDRPHVFERFYTGGDGVADRRRGTGLGLALCKSIVEAHGGTIDLYDNEPSGTVFRFTLPTESEEES